MKSVLQIVNDLSFRSAQVRDNAFLASLSGLGFGGDGIIILVSAEMTAALSPNYRW